MKRLAEVGYIIVAVALAAPLMAGEGERCTASTQDCLNYMKAYMHDRGWVGIEYDEEKNTVLRVFDNSPAQQVGFRKGDVMVAINGIDINDQNADALEKIKQNEMKPGNRMTYTVARAGMKKNLEVTLVELPDEIIAQWVGRHMLEAHADEIQLASKN